MSLLSEDNEWLEETAKYQIKKPYFEAASWAESGMRYPVIDFAKEGNIINTTGNDLVGSILLDILKTKQDLDIAIRQKIVLETCYWPETGDQRIRAECRLAFVPKAVDK